MAEILPFGDRARQVRAVGVMRFTANPLPGDWFYNTHHQNYQAVLGNGLLRRFDPVLVEMTEAQFQRWLSQLQEMRRMTRKALKAGKEKVA